MSYASPHHVTLRLHHVTLRFPHVIPRFPHVIPRAVAESIGPCDFAQGDTLKVQWKKLKTDPATVRRVTEQRQWRIEPWEGGLMSYASPHHVTLRFPHVIPRAVAESIGPCDYAQGDTLKVQWKKLKTDPATVRRVTEQRQWRIEPWEGGLMSYVLPPHVTLRLHHVTLRFPHVIPRAVAESIGPCDCAQGDTCTQGDTLKAQWKKLKTDPATSRKMTEQRQWSIEPWEGGLMSYVSPHHVIPRFHYVIPRFHYVILREVAGSIDEAT